VLGVVKIPQTHLYKGDSFLAYADYGRTNNYFNSGSHRITLDHSKLSDLLDAEYSRIIINQIKLEALKLGLE
jgi:hypothetical protein